MGQNTQKGKVTAGVSITRNEKWALGPNQDDQDVMMMHCHNRERTLTNMEQVNTFNERTGTKTETKT